MSKQPTGKPTPQQLRALCRRDPVLGKALRQMPPFPGFPESRGPRTHFESLCRAIAYQQLSGRAAATIFGRVRALGSAGRFPRPEQVLELPPTELRGAGLSQAKVDSLVDLATRVCDGQLRLSGLHRYDDERVIEELIQVRGIGRWSAQMFLLFRMGRLNVMPTGDLGIWEGLRRLDGLAERPKPAAVAERSSPWQPLCSVASWVLWRLTDGADVPR